MVFRLFDQLKAFLYKGENKAGLLVTLLLWMLVLGPLLAVLMQVAFPGFFWGNLQLGPLDLLLEVFRRPFWQMALLNSLLLSICTAILGTLLGAGLALFRACWSFPTARWLDAAVWMLFITPSFIIAQGWLMFAAKNGVAAHLLGEDYLSAFIFRPAGLIFILTLSKFPLAYITLSAAFDWQDNNLAYAARLSGASSIRTWLTVRIPLLKPAFGSALVLVFMDAIGDFGLPATFSAVYRFPTLPYAIYSSIYTSPIRFDMAGVLSFYLVLIIMAAIILHSYMLKGANYDSLSANATRIARVRMPGFKKIAACCCNLLFLAIAIGIPIGSTLMISILQVPSSSPSGNRFTFVHYAQLFADQSLFWNGFIRSLKIATIAALFGAMLGATIAYVLNFAHVRFKTFIEWIAMVSLAIPGVVLGIGYIFFWNQKWLEPLELRLYGTPTILILAAVAGSIPIITRVMSGSMAKIPRTMLEAAQLQGISFWGRVFKILLPLCKSALITAALSAFGASMFDLATNSILYPPGQLTLPVTINKAFERLDFGYASAATVLGGALVTIIILLVYRLTNWRDHRNKNN